MFGIKKRSHNFQLHIYLLCMLETKRVCMLSHFSCVQLFASLWTVARQASLSMGFPREEYWSALPFPSPGNRPTPRIKPVSPAL